MQAVLASICVASVVGLYFVVANPPFQSWPFEGTSMLSAHLLLELVAIVVAALIVTIAWHTGELRTGGSEGVVVAGFLVVAVCDLVHSVTYAGMPALLGEASTPRAIFFWLCGRSAEVATLGLLALLPAWRPSRATSLAVGILIAAALVCLGSYRIDLVPATYVAGTGVTPFKAGFEYALCAANALVAIGLWRRARAANYLPYALMSTSAFVMGIGELAFSSYVSPSDFQNIFGHVYKVVAYLLLYRATFVTGICAPYEAMRESEARARESEMRIRSLGDNLPNCVVYQLVRESDGTRRFSYISEACAAINGVPAEEALRDSGRLYSLVIPEDRTALEAAEERSAQTMQVFNLPVRVRKADGEQRWMHFFSRPRRLDDQRTAWDGVQIDITERQLAADERSRLELQLREAQKMEAIGTLAGGIAHDFNNVLGAIIGNVALAREEFGAGLREAGQRSLGQVERAALRARGLVQRILGFSRRKPAQRATQSVKPVLEDCVALLRATIPAGVAFHTHIDEEARWTQVDASELQQIIVNLATNAWQALEGRNGNITVGLDCIAVRMNAAGALPPGDYVHLWVSDDGCGMSEATRQRIFEPFYTTKLTQGGTGLGLPVVHGIVRAHGGTIDVESAPGAGSTFHVYLPSMAAPLAAASNEAGPRKAADASVTARVLYVDDDEVMSLLVERLLAREGHEVTAFRDAERALAAVSGEPGYFGVVVTDYNMPAMSGLEVARRLRAMNAHVPVIITTGFVSETLEEHAAEAGVFRVVRKEHVLEELALAVMDALEQGADTLEEA